MNSELLPQADVIAAIEPRRRSGEEGQMAPGLCAMLVVYVSTRQYLERASLANTSSRLCKVDSQDGRQASNDAFQSTTQIR